MDGEGLTLVSRSLAETQRLGSLLGQLLDDQEVICLEGELGTGKTSLIQAIGRAQGVTEPITSPTFTLVNEYPGRFRLFHVDLYRLDDESDLEDIGLYELLECEGIVAIEWAEKLSDDLLSSYLAVQFETINDQVREISIFAYGQEAKVLIKALG